MCTTFLKMRKTYVFYVTKKTCEPHGVEIKNLTPSILELCYPLNSYNS